MVRGWGLNQPLPAPAQPRPVLPGGWGGRVFFGGCTGTLHAAIRCRANPPPPAAESLPA